MRLRVLLFLQLLFSLVVLFGFMSTVLWTFWEHYNIYLPDSLSIGNADVPLSFIVLIYTVLLAAVTLLVFTFIYLIFDRICIKPIKAVTRAMSDFAKTQKFEPLPPVSQTSTEIKELSLAYTTFTTTVKDVHERDVEMSRIKTDFISTAAHQLRTPLTGIRWALEALSKETLTPDQTVFVRDALSKSHDLVAIVGTLLDISSIESGKHKYVFKRLHLQDLVVKVVHDFMHQAAEQSVTLTYVAPSPSLPEVNADEDQIKWVLNNLIENAIRYTPAGGTVRVSLEEAMPRRLHVLVHDTGIGIAIKDKNNIFERFYRAENAIAKENKGNGLGLYISRTVATDHGGDLTFAGNTDGPGTTFTLSLPVV